ncbi:MAG TPA: PEGA domain-containing protein, partial [Polyangiaceae bacterium]|nr:PEGA domain-containing protein [Polyangiaceae bacterium]
MARHHSLRLSALLVLVAFSAPLMVQAQPRDAAARRTAYLDAKTAIVAKDWTKAQRILNELWAESQTYDVALGLGQAELNLAQYMRAAEHLGFALSNLPPRESPELRARAEELMNLAKAQLSSVRVTVDPAGAEVLVDGQSVGRAPLGAEVPVEVGQHVISARQPGYDTADVRVDALSGQVHPVELHLSLAAGLAPLPVAAPPPSERSPRAQESTAAEGSDLLPASRPIPASAYVAAGVAVA